MRAAADFTRHFLQKHGRTDVLIISQTLTTIARIIWKQNIQLAKSFYDREPLAKQHLHIADGRVSIINQQAFSVAVAEARTNLISQRQQDIENSGGNNKENRARKLCEQAKLWIKHDKKFVLHGIGVNGHVFYEEPRKTIETGKAW